jgi:hypothetical protein
MNKSRDAEIENLFQIRVKAVNPFLKIATESVISYRESP